MSEVWDVYDKNRNKTGKICLRGPGNLKEGEYHIVVNAVILNSNNEILIAQRAKHKIHPLKWECSGGSILAGETSIGGILREIEEEIGLKFKENEAILLKTLRRDVIPPNFKDIWLFKKDVDFKDITFNDGEVVDIKWVNIDEFMEMKKSNQMIESLDLNEDDLRRAVKL